MEFTAVNNIFNDEKIDAFSEHLSPVAWVPERYIKIDDVSAVKEKVLQHAGVLKNED